MLLLDTQTTEHTTLSNAQLEDGQILPPPTTPEPSPEPTQAPMQEPEPSPEPTQEPEADRDIDEMDTATPDEAVSDLTDAGPSADA